MIKWSVCKGRTNTKRKVTNMMDIWGWRCAVKHLGNGLGSNWVRSYEDRIFLLEREEPCIINK